MLGGLSKCERGPWDQALSDNDRWEDLRAAKVLPWEVMREWVGHGEDPLVAQVDSQCNGQGRICRPERPETTGGGELGD